MAGRPGGRRRAAAFPMPALVVLAVLSGACSTRASAGGPALAELTVLAAASLREPLRDLAAAYESAAGVRLMVTADASSALRAQIEQGARGDVFLSADEVNPAALAVGGHTDGAIVAFAGNRLAIIVPVDNPGRLADPAGLALPGVEIIAAGEQVPITRHAAELVARLAVLPGYPVGYARAYEANIVSREDNVTAVLAKIELGEGDAAIVYASDTLVARDVVTLAVPEPASVTATYAGAVLATTTDAGAARAFLDWLAGPDAGAILVRHGFVAVP